MLKNKNEDLGVFKKFRAQVKDGDKKIIKVFRTNRGGEFTSNDFKTFCEDAGIERHFTTPYTPQQNGVVERRNRTVVEMARSYLKEMNLQMELWGEAVRHSVFVLNRLPTRPLSDQTPYEAWTGLKPNIGHIRVFGCLTHMKIPNVDTTKLADRSMEVVNLGREPGMKGYRLYDPISKRVLVSRDVIFDEEKSWPWGQEREDEVHNLGTSSILDVSGTEKEDQTDTGYVDGSEVGGAENNTPPHSPVTSTSRDDHDESGEPRRYRSLVDVYNETEPVEVEEELMFMGVEEPQNFEQAVKERSWRSAMHKELESIEKNDTWKLTELPNGHKVIDLKWIFKLKKDASGRVVKHKARLVAKGYVQEHGIDFEEIFAPVTRLETVRLLLALSAKNNWEVHHLDVKTAFLNGDINEEVYVAQPKGYVKKGQEKLVYKLSKALYGLRQAPRAWYAKLNSCLEKLGFKRCPYEHSVYTRQDKEDVLIIGVYVDDLLVTGSSVSCIEAFKKQMNNFFEMSDLGKLAYYLGIEVEQGDGFIELKQTGYAKKLLKQAGLEDCNPTKFPMDPKEQLTKDEGGKQVDATQYMSLVGGLRYLVHTRPDIAFAVGIVSRFMEHPTILHMNAIKQILRYIRGTLEVGLVYSKKNGNNSLTGYSDSDLAGDIEDRRSTGGMVFYLNESLITWVSQKQRRAWHYLLVKQSSWLQLQLLVRAFG